jgi:hypothetical protein
MIDIGKNIRYISPKYINKDTERNVTLYFRAKKTIKNAEISLTCNKRIILKRKYRIVKPSEIIKLNLENKIIKIINDNTFIDLTGRDNG